MLVDLKIMKKLHEQTAKQQKKSLHNLVLLYWINWNELYDVVKHKILSLVQLYNIKNYAEVNQQIKTEDKIIYNYKNKSVNVKSTK